MIKYTCIRNSDSKVLDSWNSSFRDGSFYNPIWGAPGTFTIQSYDTAPDEAAETAKQAQIATLKQRLNELDGLADLTATEVKEVIRKLLKFLLLKGRID